MPDERPAESKSFWATLPGIMTAFAGVCAAVTALITALFSVGLIGAPHPGPTLAPPPATAPSQASPTPAPATSPGPRVAPDEQSRAELEETRRKLEEATRAKQQADAARARADAEAARLRQAHATAAAEAKRQSELEAARKKAEDAEAARAKGEAEIARLRREQAARSPTTSSSRPAPSTDPAGSTPSYENAPTRDAITSFRVLSTTGEKIDVEIAFSYDPRVHGDRVLAGVHLLYQGTVITGYQPTTAFWQRGKSVVRVVVRTTRGRQSDELEVFLYKSGERPFLNRRFPFAKTFG